MGGRHGHSVKETWCMGKRSSYFFVAVFVSLAPIQIAGHSYGPAPRRTGAPGDDARACTVCHSTSALNSGTGSVNMSVAKRTRLHSWGQATGRGAGGGSGSATVGIRINREIEQRSGKWAGRRIDASG